jgi:hypothetical protein
MLTLRINVFKEDRKINYNEVIVHKPYKFKMKNP